MKSTRRRRALGLAGLAAAVLLACQWSAAGDPYYPYDGLPRVSFDQGGWSYTSQVGMSETAKAKQWVRVPALTAASWGGLLPTGVNPEPGVSFRWSPRGDAAFVSPPGYVEGYGHMAPMTVRTVGFGLMPAEATVQISQRRKDGLPIPIHVEMRQDEVLPSRDFYFPPAHVQDAFDVKVTNIAVDGVDLELNGNCRTVTPAPADLHGPAFTIPRSVLDSSDIAGYLWSLDPSTYFNPLYGGELQGTVDIPAFTGCTTASGDDLSPMITASVSGPGNHVVFQTAKLCNKAGPDGADVPPKPGENTPERSGCPANPPLPYPARN